MNALKPKIPAFACPEFNATCPVCKKGFGDKKDVLLAACQHRYHDQCVYRSMQYGRRRICIVCRVDALPMVRSCGLRLYEFSSYCEALPLALCRYGDADSLRRVLALDRCVAQESFRDALTWLPTPLLHIAAANGQVECVKVLLESEAKVSAVDSCG